MRIRRHEVKGKENKEKFLNSTCRKKDNESRRTSAKVWLGRPIKNPCVGLNIKKQTTQWKNGQETQTFLQRRQPDGQWACKICSTLLRTEGRRKARKRGRKGES